MPTEGEYGRRFELVAESVMGRGFNTKAEIRRGVAEANRAVRVEREKIVKEISARWKEKFAEIKAENDAWQKALADAYKRELQMIEERTGDLEEGLQK
jgi:hypothetical protein